MDKSRLPALIAHRGASGYAPENTISSMLMAKSMGIRWVEFDVMLSACGAPVIIHDIKVNRTTDGRGHVHQYSYDELSKLDAGSWFSKAFKDHKIPSLKAMIYCLKSNDSHEWWHIATQQSLLANYHAIYASHNRWLVYHIAFE